MIRPANLLDIPRMVQLGAAMHAESRFASLSWDADKVAELIAGLIDHRQGLALVAVREGQVIGGFLGACEAHFFSSDKFACDLALFVEPGKRGGVAAARLLKAFVTWAQKQGASMIQSGITTGVDLDKSTKLYQACGFAHVGNLFEYQGESNV